MDLAEGNKWFVVILSVSMLQSNNGVRLNPAEENTKYVSAKILTLLGWMCINISEINILGYEDYKKNPMSDVIYILRFCVCIV